MKRKQFIKSLVATVIFPPLWQACTHPSSESEKNKNSVSTIDVPENIRIESVTSKKCIIYWSIVAKATQYVVDISEHPSFTNFVVENIASKNASYVATGLKQGTVYYVRVKAVTNVYQSAYSLTQSFTTRSLTKISQIVAFGDSITAGYAASYSYVQLIANTYRASLDNYAVPGRGSFRAAKEANRLYKNHTADLLTIMAGFNDLRRSGPKQSSLNKIQHCYQSVLAKFFMDVDNTYPASASQAFIQQSGFEQSYPVYIDGEFASTLNGTPIYTTQNGASFHFSFTGTTVVLGYIATGIQGGKFTLEISSDKGKTWVSKGTYDTTNQCDGVSDGEDDNDRCPAAVVLTGLGEGSHILRLKAILTGTEICIIDYVGTLIPAASHKTAVVASPPYVDSVGYAMVPYEKSSVEATIKCANVIETIADEWSANGYNVLYVNPNHSYTLDKGLGKDHIHMNDEGQKQLAEAYTTILTT